MPISARFPIRHTMNPAPRPKPTTKVDFSKAWFVGFKKSTSGATLQTEPGKGNTAWVRADSQGKLWVSTQKPGAIKSSERAMTKAETDSLLAQLKRSTVGNQQATFAKDFLKAIKH